MKTYLPAVLALFLLLSCNKEKFDYPEPTGGDTEIYFGDESDNQQNREAWFEMMHAAALGTDWKAIEYNNAMARQQRRSRPAASSVVETFANGTIEAEWFERGSDNQSGSVRNTEYDPLTDEIYTVADGGTLFRGKRDGSNWEVINQNLRFDKGLLNFIDGPNGRRLVATIGRIPHYSDDNGVNWTSSTGINYTASNGEQHSPVVSSDQQYIYLLSKRDFWTNFKLYRSKDAGQTFQAIQDLSSSNRSHFKLFQPPGSSDIYLVHRKNTISSDIYRINDDMDTPEMMGGKSIAFGNARTNIAGAVHHGKLHLFIYVNHGDTYPIFKSVDTASTWQQMGTVPERPWEDAGIYNLPSDSSRLFMGAVECYSSNSSGQFWIKANNWYDYYDDIEHALHADMMFFKEYTDNSGEKFLLVSNHGGLSISYTNGNTYENIGLQGLNVSQYYDVVSPSTNSNIIFAGSQDQGFQRTFTSTNSTKAEDFDQARSGDYGHLTLAANEQHLWMVYPFGAISLYTEPVANRLTAGWSIPNHTSVWIPPLVENKSGISVNEGSGVIMAGGSLANSSGSHLIELYYRYNSSGEIEAVERDFDFSAATGGGNISAIEISEVDPDRWYVATTNGRFFFSTDGGYEWTESLTMVPQGQYLYGQAILASSIEENVVYLAGSGYTGAAVWVSRDGGDTFEPMLNDLPVTLAYDLALSPTEDYLFAATEAGPYVYSFIEDSWFDLSGDAAPSTTYWSVQYLERSGADDIVRFGTYGRGIWDLNVKSLVVSTDDLSAKANIEKLLVYPNPSSDQIKLSTGLLEPGSHQLTINDMQGKQLLSKDIDISNEDATVAVSSLPIGNYIISVQAENGKRAVGRFTKK